MKNAFSLITNKKVLPGSGTCWKPHNLFSYLAKYICLHLEGIGMGTTGLPEQSPLLTGLCWKTAPAARFGLLTSDY